MRRPRKDAERRKVHLGDRSHQVLNTDNRNTCFLGASYVDGPPNDAAVYIANTPRFKKDMPGEGAQHNE